MAINSNLLAGLIAGLGLFLCSSTYAGGPILKGHLDRITTENYVSQDTIPLNDRFGDFLTDEQYNPFDILPSNVEQKVEYDLDSDSYIIYEKIGDEYFRTPTVMTFDEYMEFRSKQQEEDYFDRLAGIESEYKSGSGRIDPLSKINIQKNLVDRLFGGNGISIEPQGNIDLTFGADYQRVKNPNIDINRQTQGPFLDFGMDIKMNVEGNIGDKMNLGFNYDTNASFDFDRKIKLAYDSEQFTEDDIIKKIEAGNVSLPLRGSLIQGAQSLFGLKTELQFGHLRLTAIASQQRSKQETVAIQNGATVTEFEIKPDEFDENRHFFISHYHRNNYEEALSNMPYIKSNFRVSQIEVWISDDRQDYQQNQTMVCAVSDIAEQSDTLFSNPFATYHIPDLQIDQNLITIPDANGNTVRLPDNRQNELYQRLVNDPDVQRLAICDEDSPERKGTEISLENNYGLKSSQGDFAIFQGRKLSPGEYSFNPQLGTLSLNVRLRPNQVLGVSYEYFYTLRCDEVYKVGSMTDEGGVSNSDRNGETQAEGVIFTKLLKHNAERTNHPAWDLMMKNVYPLRSSQLDQKDFEFDIFFEDDASNGSLKRYLPIEGLKTTPLLQAFGLDKLNNRNDPQPDGIFDFVPGVTVVPQTSSIIFPVLEPFGQALEEMIGDTNVSKFYTYHELYDNFVTSARESLDKNKFLMKGRYKNGVSSEYSLGAWNIPQGSVTVRAGSAILVEGADYEVDYAIGRVRILNESYLQQGIPINISYEDNSIFSLQQKTMMGLRADYEVNENFRLGATYLRLFERPFTQKVNIGEDPINNRIFGFDVDYSKEAPLITKIVDKLPFYSTNQESTVNFTAEVAALRPGHSRAVNIPGENNGVVSLDDFEGAVSGFPLSSQAQTQWILASTPRHQDMDLFPEGDSAKIYNQANRANLSWYVLDQTLLQNTTNNHAYTRNINQDELFDRQIPQGILGNLQTFDLNYSPDVRGPYNYDIPGGITDPVSGIQFSKGAEYVDGTVMLNEPETRWAGIMRYMPNNDFQATNYEFIEFWMLNPYMERPDMTNHPVDDDGFITFHLGNVSEDIMKDGLQFYENALPTPGEDIPVKEELWGRVPLTTPNNNGFDLEDRALQDVGFDGMNDTVEREFFLDYLLEFDNPPFNTVQELFRDPSNDNYVDFNNLDVYAASDDLLKRYSKFNNPENNSPDFNSGQQLPGTGTGQNNNNLTNRNLRGQPQPDQEDLNNNRSLDNTESYYEYKIPIQNGGGSIDAASNPFIRDVRTITRDGQPDEEWYRFRIPINQGESINGIQGFRSIQFMRMIVSEFETQKTFRLADFELIRNQWRILPPVCTANDVETFEFNIDAVGIEENSRKEPFKYILPRGIQRERLFNSLSNVLQDEKSLVLRYDGMLQGCEGSVYKLNDLDLRVYEKMQMFVHAEKEVGSVQDNGDVGVFIRIGKDFTNNYYEYMIPATLSDTILSRTEADYIWPVHNKFNFELDLFPLLKKVRIVEGVATLDTFSLDNERITQLLGSDPVLGQATNLDRGGGEIYESIAFKGIEDSIAGKTVYLPEGHVITIKGNPSLGKVKDIQIGVRNISDKITGMSGEVWVNELRLSGLQERGGYAGLARMDIQMADLGQISASGSYNSRGWGSLDQKVQERALESKTEYDVATSLELGKFFPSKWGVRVPFYAQYAKSIITPEYDAYDLDITLEDEYDIRPNEIAQVNDRSRTVNTIKTFNFTNVRKERSSGRSRANNKKVSTPQDRNKDKSQVDAKTADTDKDPKKPKKPRKPMPWNIENFSASYAYTEIDYQDPIIELDRSVDQKLGIDYGYTNRAKYFEPFKKLKPKALKLIKAFNFNPVPNTISFSSNINRYQSQRTYRPIEDDPTLRFDDRRFEWERSYDLNWNLTKSLKLNYSALNESYIDEFRQVGYAEDPNNRDWLDENGTDVSSFVSSMPDTVSNHWKNNIRNGGRNTNYNHQIGVNYTLPMKYIPGLDWVDIKAQYRSDYTWAAGRLIILDDNWRPGAVIQNGQNRSITANLNFDKLYNKSKYIKALDKTKPVRRTSRTSKTEDPKDPRANPKDPKKDRSKKSKEPGTLAKLLVRPLLSLRSIRINYKEDFTTIVPGILQAPQYFGLSSGFSSPGAGFVLGLQPDITFGDSNNWLFQAADKGWITPSNLLNQEVVQTQAQNLEAKIKIEPWKDFKIDVDFKKNYRITHQEEFKNKNPNFFGSNNNEAENYQQLALRDFGSFEMTYFAMNTLFSSDIDALFQKFEDHRSVISYRLENGENSGSHVKDGVQYAEGYGKQSSQVLVPAFIAAYTDKDPNNVNLDLENQVKKLSFIPKPNWNLRYNGLTKLPWFRDRLSSFTIEHAYSSTLRVNNFSTDIQFDPVDPYEDLKVNGNYYSRIEIPAIQIQEQFNPIIGFSMKTKKDLNLEFEYNKTRGLDLSVNTASELNENKKTEFVFGFGYTIKDSKFLQKKKGRGRSRTRPKGLNEKDEEDDKKKKRGGNVTTSRGSDMTFMLNIKYGDDITKVHEIDLGASAETARGTETLSIQPSVDYILNDNLTLRAFIDYSKSEPKISTQFPVTSVNGGITLRMTLN